MPSPTRVVQIAARLEASCTDCSRRLVQIQRVVQKFGSRDQRTNNPVGSALIPRRPADPGSGGFCVRVARTSGRWEDPSALSALSAAVGRAHNADKADNGLRVGLRVNHRHQETRSTATGRQRAAPRSFMSGLDPFATPGDDGVSSKSGAINARQNRWTTRPATPNSSVDSPPKLFL